MCRESEMSSTYLRKIDVKKIHKVDKPKQKETHCILFYLGNRQCVSFERLLFNCSYIYILAELI